MNLLFFILVLAANIVIEEQEIGGKKLKTTNVKNQRLIYFLLTKSSMESARRDQEDMEHYNKQLEELEKFFREEDGNAITTAQ